MENKLTATKRKIWYLFATKLCLIPVIITFTEFSARKLRLHAIFTWEFVLSSCQKYIIARSWFSRANSLRHFSPDWKPKGSYFRKVPAQNIPRDQNWPMITKDHWWTITSASPGEIGMLFICQKSTGPTTYSPHNSTHILYLNFEPVPRRHYTVYQFPINIFSSAQRHYMIN